MKTLQLFSGTTIMIDSFEVNKDSSVFVTRAYWIHNCEFLTDDELDLLNESKQREGWDT